MWNVLTTSEFDRWFKSLRAAEKIEVIARVELLKQFGPALSRPHADTLKGSRYSNMKELRGKTATSVLRIAFAFDPERQAILLVGGNKAGVSEQRFYRKLIDNADRLFESYLSKRSRNGPKNAKD